MITQVCKWSDFYLFIIIAHNDHHQPVACQTQHRARSAAFVSGCNTSTCVCPVNQIRNSNSFNQLRHRVTLMKVKLKLQLQKS